MKIYYISPSTIPSRSANSIHVVNMCEGLNEIGYKVTLFAHANSDDSSSGKNVLWENYGVNSDNIELKMIYSKIKNGIELLIALKSLSSLFFDFFKNSLPKYIISRNLYAALFLGVWFRVPAVYETHCPEYGFRGKIQKWVILSKKIKVVVISQALKNNIQSVHNILDTKIHVFHDAARSGQLRLDYVQRDELKRKLLASEFELDNYQRVIGYFGHLYAGRGINIIEEMAKLNLHCAFIVYGGNDIEIEEFRLNNGSKNLFFMGHICPKDARAAMPMMDVLLMPYQRSVSIGITGIDTSKWMSPMKMFEYLSVGVPIISSNIPVLREILVDGENCLMVESDDISAWCQALTKILSNPELEEKLGSNSYRLYKGSHTWDRRARAMINLS
jgi:glycosyltransferase involved in cell wall biosynthesis